MLTGRVTADGGLTEVGDKRTKKQIYTHNGCLVFLTWTYSEASSCPVVP